jgi:hypothetical protein
MKRIRLYILVAFILPALFSCMNVNPEYTAPQGNKYIGLDTLELMLYDIHLTDAVITSNVYNPTKNIQNDTLMYESIYEKYSCSREHFEESLLYYMHNELDSLYGVYEKIIQKLNREKGENI